MKNDILLFLKNRPKVVACYGYGSGVFKQSGYSKKVKTQVDLILVVEDLKKWHIENIEMNPKDYTLSGKRFIKNSSISKLKGNTGIVYLTDIKYNGTVYKYGTIEEKDLINYLNTWDSFYMPGRFQKPMLVVSGKNVIDKAIKYNRDMALLVSLLTLNKEDINLVDIYIGICGLSYIGDTRMKFAENPRKVFNIVTGSFNELKNIYGNTSKYYKMNNRGIITLNDKVIMDDIKLLPSSLIEYIENTSDKNIIKDKIDEYLTLHNKIESKSQTIKGLRSNGLIKSLIYALRKIIKRIKK